MSKDWMLTHTRRQVFPLDFKIEDIDILDIAASLSKQCRYNGHVDKFYSVAEHAILVSIALERDGYDDMTQFIGLHHDDSEAYLGDQIKPLKNALEGKGFSFKEFELDIEEKISQHFFMRWPWPEVVHEYDRAIVRDEKEILKKGGPGWEAFNIPEKGLGVELFCLDWKKAEMAFLQRHCQLIERSLRTGE